MSGRRGALFDWINERFLDFEEMDVELARLGPAMWAYCYSLLSVALVVMIAVVALWMSLSIALAMTVAVAMETVDYARDKMRQLRGEM